MMNHPIVVRTHRPSKPTELIAIARKCFYTSGGGNEVKYSSADA